MRRSSVMSSWATWPEALAEALRLYRVTGEKFTTGPMVYTVRKRRTSWPSDVRQRRWNTGHERWLVLVGSNIPDALTANPRRRKT